MLLHSHGSILAQCDSIRSGIVASTEPDHHPPRHSSRVGSGENPGTPESRRFRNQRNPQGGRSTPPPPRIHDRVGNRRDQIKRVAAGLFVENGVAGTSVRDIAEGVGVLSGSLYHHSRPRTPSPFAILKRFPDRPERPLPLGASASQRNARGTPSPGPLVNRDRRRARLRHGDLPESASLSRPGRSGGDRGRGPHRAYSSARSAAHASRGARPRRSPTPSITSSATPADTSPVRSSRSASAPPPECPERNILDSDCRSQRLVTRPIDLVTTRAESAASNIQVIHRGGAVGEVHCSRCARIPNPLNSVAAIESYEGIYIAVVFASRGV
ncbi:TetR/AcrR family transcriptional regulator [Nocardia sp. NPDC003345]